MNNLNNLSIITNQDKRDIGFWIRPDENIGHCHYDKLFLQNKYKGSTWSWQTEDKMFSYEELSTTTYVLNFREDKRAWTIQASTTDCNIVPPQIDGDFNKDELLDYDGSGMVSRKYMLQQSHSMIEESELYDISWTRIHDMSELLDDYDGEDIVWRVQKCWSHVGDYARSNSVEKTIWLTDYNVLSNGNQEWSVSDVSCYEDPEHCAKRYVEFIAGKITRPIASKPYETSLWTADVPVFFDFPSKLAALHNSKNLCLSYIANNPLAIKYVVARAFLRKDYEQMKMKEREWNVYNEYSPGNETVLYDDSYPFFHDN